MNPIDHKKIPDPPPPRVVGESGSDLFPLVITVLVVGILGILPYFSSLRPAVQSISGC